MVKYAILVAACLVIGGGGQSSAQEIKVGLTADFTGATAAVGAPFKLAAEIFPDHLGGLPVKWIVLDDAGNTSTTVKNARKFVDEDKVDIILGSNTIPSTVAMFGIAAQSATPQIALVPVDIPTEQRAWLFNLPQSARIMVGAIVDDMKSRNFKRVAFIGYNDGWGELNWKNFEQLANAGGLQIVAKELYSRNDTSVTAQVLKLLEAKPDAVFVGASATPATLPHLTLKDQGFKGQIYHTHGAVSKPFLNAGGKELEGAILPTGPIVVAASLPDSNPIKKVGLDFSAKYAAKYGPGAPNPFAGYAWDAMLLLEAAVPDAAAKAKPGTPEFRSALRDSLASGREVVGTHAVYKFTDQDRYGVDDRSRVLVIVKNGAFALYK
ncbi:Extracellular ligand-binding receptor [Rhodopseudomonas palustris HaA2]|uniref:Extracellular ligand-binding receptor n=1 Tax=Rhodopseudomonas palustris (strain HaA2) TaxID=316058 RepID=Q2J2A7_RHOP2|nr:ABC transporter substrate-binding protein [Rhodopseudomonas palustris]ABD05403.1 Extracellular ligand-binding receptor [Rhodopseudomonas palustris HaA2]